MNTLSEKILVCLFSDSNFVAVNILETLLSKNCYVIIVTKDVENWEILTSNVQLKNNFKIVDKKKFSFVNRYDYVVIVSGFLNKEESYKDLFVYQKYLVNSKVKTLIVLPREAFDKEQDDNLYTTTNSLIVYLSDVIGPRYDTASNLFIVKILNEIKQNLKMTLGVGELFYPLNIFDVTKLLTRWLFSFGPYGNKLMILGPETSGSKFWEICKNIYPNLKLLYNNKVEARRLFTTNKIEVLKTNIPMSIVDTFKWLNRPIVNFKEIPLKQRKKTTPKYLKPIILLLTIIFVLPFITSLTSAGFFYYSYKQFLKGNDPTFQNSILISKTFSVIGRKESQALSHIPLIGRVYNELAFADTLASGGADVFLTLAPIVRNSSLILNNVLGNDIYDLDKPSFEIENNLDKLYGELSLIQTDAENAAQSKSLVAEQFLSRVNLTKLKNLALNGNNILKNLPQILGKGDSKTYLLLFQNNMELRPTGGFIGSYGISTFDSGRMTDLTVSDIYSADGQLKGHVEPPLPIKNYLNEANWFFRDSNWDPDFPTSAKRAEWFLDKELAKSVDGVVAVDLDLIKEILKYTGPVFLPDFNLNITTDNLYEKTQEEVQNNFFPGTHKKASFLTALSRSLISNLGKLNQTQKVGILKTIFNSLEERHIQIYMHDNNFQGSISALNWDGGVLKPNCGDGCYADFAGLVEANVGVNKANYFIKRIMNFKFSITTYSVDRQLDLDIVNSANPALGISGKYTTYLRLIVPTDVGSFTVNDVTNGSVVPITTEVVGLNGRKEIGIFIGILGGQHKLLRFNWNSDIGQDSKITSYGFYLRKQAGTSSDPVTMEIGSNGLPLASQPKFSLTRNGSYIYNTVLGKDFFSKFTWK